MNRIFIIIFVVGFLLFLVFSSSEKISGEEEKAVAFIEFSDPEQREKNVNPSLKEGEKNNVDRPEVLIIGDLEIPLLFENKISDALKQFILEDFRVLFESSRNYEIYDLAELEQPSGNVINIAGSDFRVIKRLFFLSSRPPDLLHKYLGEIIIQNGVDKLVVPDIILNAYKDAFSLTNKHALEFESLRDFVEMITSSTEEKPFTLHPKDVFYMPDSLVLTRLEQKPELISEAQRFYSKTTRVRMPSVLDFHEIPTERQSDEIYLHAKGYSMEGEPAVPTVETGFVYHDGRWKIVGIKGM